MARHLIRVSQILDLSKSKKITERKKFLDDLQSVYEECEFVTAINKISSQDPKCSTSWNRIMQVVHDMVISEAEKSVTNTARGNSASLRSCICTVMTKTISLAVKAPGMCLDCSQLMANIFHVLGEKCFKFYHDTYMNILLNHVLSSELYRTYLTSDAWQQILSLSMNMYNQRSEISNSILLDTMRMVVQYGCPSSRFLSDVKKILPFLGKLYQETASSTDIPVKFLYKLTYAVCQKIGIENRIALCDFIESNLQPIINLEGSSEKYKMLLLIIQIHHPGGAVTKDEGAYACNWDKWKEIVRGIHKTIKRDIKSQKLSSSFLALCCEVYRQIMQDPSYHAEGQTCFQESFVSQPPKRRCLSMPVRNPIDLLTDNNLEVTWPFIQILTVLLRKYPDSLKSSDYDEFLKKITEFVIASFNNEMVMDSLCELCVVLVKLEKKYFHQMEKVENVRICWERIWDTIIRALTIDLNQVQGHKLLQSMIEERNALNVNLLLDLYVKNAIRWSPSSVQTLLTFCTYNPIPKELSNTGATSTKPEASIRVRLLHWALKISLTKSSNEIPVIPLANLLTSLTMKNWYDRKYRDLRNFQDSAYQRSIASIQSFERDLIDEPNTKIITDLERCYLAAEFRENFCHHEIVPTEITTKVSSLYVQEVLDNLIKTISNSMAKQLADEDICIFIKKTNVISKLWSNFEEAQMSDNPAVIKLGSLFAQAFKKITTTLMSNNSRHFNLLNSIDALENLYRVRYQWKVANTLVALSSVEFVTYIYNLVLDDEHNANQDENSPYGEKSRRQSLKIKKNVGESSDSCHLKNLAHKILTHYCCAGIGREMSADQTSVLRKLMRSDLKGIDGTSELCRALTMFKACGTSHRFSISKEDLEMAAVSMMNLFLSRKNNEIVVRAILNILPNYIETAFRLGHDPATLVRIFSLIHKRLVQDCYGYTVHVEFVRCLTEIIRLDPSIEWSLGKEAQERRTPVIEASIQYIKYPSYMVRLEAVKAVHVAFSSKKLSVPWKKKFFVTVHSAIGNLFIDADTMDHIEREDRRIVRIVTALHIYTAAIRANEFLHGRALFALVKMSVVKDVELRTLKIALDSVTKSEEDQRRLIDTNLHYILTRWFQADLPLQKFPWILAGCTDQEEFSRTYIEKLLIIKLQRQEFQHLLVLCKNLDVSVEKTIENSFPSIVALLLPMSFDETIEGGRNSMVYARDMYLKLRSNRDEFARVERFQDLLQKKLSEVITSLVKRLHDENNFQTLFQQRIFLPKVNSPNFSADIIQSCLDHLITDLRQRSQSLMEYLVAKCPSVLQKVLLNLFCNIYEVKCEYSRLRAFHQYAFFYSFVFRELPNSYFDAMSLYVVRDASHSMLALIKEETQPLSEMACTCFRTFLKGVLPTRANELNEILSFAVSTLLPIIKAGKVPGAMSILEFLIVDARVQLAEAIERLDSFPNDEAFEMIKRVHNELKYRGNEFYSLEDEINHFLNALREKTLSCSLEGLTHVRNQLSTRKNELRRMYSKLEKLRGFAEDCTSSTIHRLVHKLVHLTRSSDADVALEAAKCLGELGPADLTTMILQPENVYAKEKEEAAMMLTFKVICQLPDYLVDNSTSLRKASADALYTVFSTTWGIKFMEKTFLNNFLSSEKIENSTLHACIYPFGTHKDTGKLSLNTIYIDRGNWARFVDDENDLWIPASYDSYSKWIIEITCKLLDCFVNFYTKGLKPVCRLSVEFCEMLLPRLVNFVTETEKNLVNDVYVCINRFFAYLFEIISENFKANTVVPERTVKRGDATRSYECVRCMLNVVNFMRIQSRDTEPLALDYLFIAKAAQYCSAYFTSVLYAELWCESILQGTGFTKIPGRSVSMIDEIYEINPEKGKLLQDIVREAYLHIGDPDSIYGCGLSHLTDSSFKTQHYIHLRQWDKVMLAQDVELTCGNTASHSMLNALHHSGLYYLLGRMINTVKKEAENVEDFMYETAWRLADWTMTEAHGTNDTIAETCSITRNAHSNGYHASHYRALKSLHNKDFGRLKNALDSARMSIINSLRNTSLECSQTVYPILSQLQMLREIEEFATTDAKNYNELFLEWHQQDFVDTHDFQYVEPILSQRIVMYKSRNTNNNILAELMKNSLISTHLNIADVAEKQGYFPIAGRALDSLAKTEGLTKIARDQLTYQEALLAWRRNDPEIGRYLLRDLIKKSSQDRSLCAKALRVYGNWMAQSKSENPQAVINKYYKQSIIMARSIEEKSFNDIKNLTDAQADLAQFADAQYQQIIEFMKSPQYDSLAECGQLQNKRTKSETMGNNSDEKKAMLVYQRQVTDDATELENIRRERDMYLVLAAEYYLDTLKNGDDHDLLIFRLVSLWLDNTLHERLDSLLVTHLHLVPSHKFVAMLPQLAPHMSNERTKFTEKINNLMERCALEHPHQTLPILFALKNTHMDKVYKPSQMAAASGENKRSEPRVIAAEGLINDLMNSPIAPIVKETSELSRALIMLAYFATPSQPKSGSSFNIPRTHPIMKIRDYCRICVPTISMDVNRQGNYDNIVGIREYIGKFEIPGGIQAPKKVICIGTDGVQRKQLVKGQDDLRQDAVMQQVCTVVNSMLKTSKETKRRKLHIRTYKIVPLSQRSGVLEWCENTLPISNVLCDIGKNKGMHSKYYPNDWSVNTCRGKFGKVDRATVDVKLETFMEICKNLNPAFHHFFLEMYPSAETWFERRLAYVRSVATTSMVGYILGLGDRHFSNILLDQSTAEVIHIDFGIAFAQGKVLPIPETVPFRLTRDMEVAMGICGVEGVMRRSCEETVAVLRDQRNILITLLQVLLYDPLFSWAITAVNTGNRDNRADDLSGKKTNKIAERALLRIEQKLQGTEDGLVSSISGQVERLIQQARDPTNLCRLYSGWQAYL